jgi:2-amino-4-hydroxy-6-hydroxymethyldihydropteridine diphosphokinase
MNITYLCLGGNIGDRIKTIDEAKLKISHLAGNITSSSSIFETEAWGVTNQNAYLNQCIKVETNYSSNELIEILLSIEKELGRERTEKNGYQSRTIDIDILFYNDEIINNSNLIIPHPRLHLRNFVLQPLNEIASEYLHPILNKSIFNLLINCEDRLDVKKIVE